MKRRGEALYGLSHARLRLLPVPLFKRGFHDLGRPLICRAQEDFQLSIHQCAGCFGRVAAIGDKTKKNFRAIDPVGFPGDELFARVMSSDFSEPSKLRGNPVRLLTDEAVDENAQGKARSVYDDGTVGGHTKRQGTPAAALERIGNRSRGCLDFRHPTEGMD